MARLIDADALIEAHYQHCNEHHGDTDIFYGWSLELMRNAPTIDAVPVIRCKDCRNWSEMQNSAGACLRHSVIDGSWWTGTDSTDYCSFAERREDE